MSTRPKRAAAVKNAVIVITDTEDDEVVSAEDDDSQCTSSTRRRENISDRAAADKAGNGRKRLGEPQLRAIFAKEAKKRRADNESGIWEPNESEPRAADVEEVAPAAPSTEGRSSFWERRRPWRIEELLAETEKIAPSTAENIVKLFQNENTIPFICRYRRDLVNHVTPERLRDIRNTYTDIVSLRKKAELIVTHLEKEKVLNNEIQEDLMCAKTNEELEFLYAPYKPANKGSLAERAKAVGLEKYADCLLYGLAPKVKPHAIVDTTNEELATEEKVIEGICYIMSHKMSKNTLVLEELRRLKSVHNIMLKCGKPKTTTKLSADKKLQSSKFENYFNFQSDIKFIKPHQTLAINRGEQNKFLSVKLELNNILKMELKRFLRDQYMKDGLQYALRSEIFELALADCLGKKLQPLLFRQVRSDLKEKAKKAAIEVFAKNVKQLLLLSPLKGERILGIDPGFTNGCKLAVISETANVLDTATIYLHGRTSKPIEAKKMFLKMLANHKCYKIALGNGTACRETEMWLTELFESGELNREKVHYSIVNENGASIYSCSDVARKEFSNLDTNLISAVSIARRLNDPLSEYVKIEPQHLGVGMYQHDINKKVLTESLNDVVSECVSYVGVDLNTASLSVLKHIAGLSEKKAEKIIEYRTTKGLFRTRKDLLSVNTIGEKTFLQCAGFVRIEPLSVGGQLQNVLDCTWVHPESYDVAKAILNKCDLSVSDIGTTEFIETIKNFSAYPKKVNQLYEEHKIPLERLQFLLVALQRPLLLDYRADFDKRPLFKQGVTRLSELSIGDIITGVVNNVTHFGAFVDVGVETNGLIYIKNMKNVELGIGDRVTTSVISIDIKRTQLGLRLEETTLNTDT